MKDRLLAVLTAFVVCSGLVLSVPASAAEPTDVTTKVTQHRLSASTCRVLALPAGCTSTTILRTKVHRSAARTVSAGRSLSAYVYTSTWTKQVCVGMINCSVYTGPGGYHLTQGGRFYWTGFRAWQKKPPSGYTGVGSHWCRKDSSLTYGVSLQGCTQPVDPGVGTGPTVARMRFEVCLKAGVVSGCDVKKVDASLYPSGTTS